MYNRHIGGENMEKEKKATNGLVTVIVILSVLLVVALSGTAYFYMKSSENTNGGKGGNNKESVVTDKGSKNNNTEKLVVENGFDTSKSLNTNGITYTLSGSYSNRGIDLKLDSQRKTMEVYLASCRFEHTYHLGWTTQNEETCAAEGEKVYEKRSEFSFDQEVSDFIIGGFGHEASGDTMLFLMKDGTIEYVPIKKAYTGTVTEKVKSFGKIPGVEGIIKLYQVSASAPNAGGYVTVLAQKADGSFYDLTQSLSSINAWS